MFRLNDFGVNRLADAHRPAPQVLFVQSIHKRELVGLAVPARCDDLGAEAQHAPDIRIDVDFVAGRQIDGERSAAVKRVDPKADVAVRFKLFAYDGVRRGLCVRVELFPPRFHLAPKLCLSVAVHCRSSCCLL